MSHSLYENHWGSPTLTFLNVLGVLGVLHVLHVLHVLRVLHVLHVLHVRHVSLFGIVVWVYTDNAGLWSAWSGLKASSPDLVGVQIWHCPWDGVDSICGKSGRCSVS